MYCRKCGQPLSEGAGFCSRCGAVQNAGNQGTDSPDKESFRRQKFIDDWDVDGEVKKDQKPKPTPGPKQEKKGAGKVWLGILIGILVSALAVCGCYFALRFLGDGSAGTAERMEGSGFDTPEAAIEAFARAYSEKDIEKMYKTCALESYAKHATLEARIEYLGAWVPNFKLTSVSSSESIKFNAELRRGQLFDWCFYKMFLYPLFHRMGEEDLFYMTYGKEKLDERGISAGDITIDHLGKIQYEGLMSVEEFCRETDNGDLWDSYTNEINRKSMKRQEDLFGGDIEERAAKFSIDGKRYYLLVAAIEYDGKWYVRDTATWLSAILNLEPSHGGLCSEDDWK
ncbi:MAG: zinc ribbon domain-containing protein [Lachnospiraceae bacterium]|nr:zinc ribbon domain-containing protein [Lachnospiraceae bacterium]